MKINVSYKPNKEIFWRIKRSMARSIDQDFNIETGEYTGENEIYIDQELDHLFQRNIHPNDLAIKFSKRSVFHTPLIN